ncbi:hypothetical protein G8770_07090 [Aestuariicella hydrocarbonica]|uniref:SPOR domain-containing protein n=1 Tax=Pseudomaricurvus hydrocarbonicus TaxID=1470433 RepID=A0A9E5JUU5_9GAMM|nr:hypothetical protein [Aestuariicella hydrocarbonica]NHO65305.1 hypothetical protein [Aestuariicella hydrocarbonica]
MNSLNLPVTARLLTLACFSCWTLTFNTTARADEKPTGGHQMDAETSLAIEIVNHYRELRSSCNDQKGDSRKMCYYRLRIGLWDYKQARETLTSKGIHLQTQAQVAEAY